MKRFLAISILVFFLIVGFTNNLVANRLAPKDNTYFTKTKNKQIYISKNNKWEKLDIIGVNLDPAKPGSFPSENAVTEKDYTRWIKYIDEMGVNCIKVPNLMSQHFYNALDKYNKDKKDPIYLMQGIYFDEVYLKDGYDPQGKTLKELFKQNIKLVLDSVHGNPNNFNNLDIIKFYSTDVSKYIIGYTLGIEFASHDLIYTEIMNEKSEYKGDYLYTNETASSFESYMAQMGDYLATYELDTYNRQSIISFIGSSSYHIVSSRTNPSGKNIIDENKEDNLKRYLDPENIKVKSKFKPGIVASYNIYPSYSEVKDYQDNLDVYFNEINKYHKLPVIIGEFGIPSSRVAGDFNLKPDKGYINETEQGEALINVYNSIKNANCAGSFIFEFQDSWHNSAWNTKQAKILDRSAYWSDAQTYSQSYGVMTFDPAKNEKSYYVDTNINEWTDSDLVSQNENMSLFMQNDEKYLYFMIKTKDNLNIDKKDVYIDLDITPKSGMNKSTQYGLNFENQVDFIINIENNKKAEVLVHDYYNSFKFYENKELYEQKPDLLKDTSDMDYFSPIYIETRPKMYVENLESFSENVIYEAGKLVYGNSNPESKDFNSAADYYIGKNYIEMRIPWGLLNFMDPSTKQIQDDFYEEFKTKPLTINNINVGVTIKEEEVMVSRLKGNTYDLDGWVMPKYNERLKESYYLLKEELTKGRRG